MEKRFFKRITALTLALSMALSMVLSGCGSKAATQDSSAAGSSGEEPQVKLGDRAFSDIPYERYDTARMDDLMGQVREKMNDEANGEEVLDLFEQVLDEYESLELSYTLAEIHNSQDTADTFYQEEISAVQEINTEKTDEISCLGKDILDSTCGDLARKNWDEDDVEYYEKYIKMTDEQKEMDRQEQKLITRYREASTEDYTVSYEGVDYTLESVEADETLSYREYYLIRDQLYAKKNETLGGIYVELVKLRQKQAESYGYDSYTDYCYEYAYDRDYTPDDAQNLCDEVKETLVYPNLLMWYSYDYNKGRELDKKIGDMPVSDQMATVKAHLDRVSPAMTDSFTYMEEHELYDLEYAPKKMRSGFTTFLNVYNEPFLFNQPDGIFYDMMTLIHEFGHYHSFCVNVDTAADHSNLDLAEIHSQGLEFLYMHFYEEMLGEEYAEVACDYTMIQKLNAVISGCLYDEFQRQVYDMEEPTLEKINALYGRLSFVYGVSTGSSPDEPGLEWVDVPHNFESPLYYISYAVSVLPAFEIWEKSLTDFNGACDLYLDVVGYGQSEDYGEVLQECGLRSPFENGYITELADTVSDYYDLDAVRTKLAS